jgi:hypothetical protein
VRKPEYNYRYRLGPPLYKESRSFPGYQVRISDDIRKAVVFLGVQDDTPGKNGIKCIGTGFLLGYDDCRYLVTAKHVIMPLADAPYIVRINKTDGLSDNINVDEGELGWFSHPDRNVDLAIAPFQFDLKGASFDVKYIGAPMPEWIQEQNTFQCGDFCYTVGLFQFMAGKNRNVPVVHSGNLALLPSDEKIPVRDWEKSGKGIRYVEGYLVQSESIQGLSGAPVFGRHIIEFNFERAITPDRDVVALLMNQDLGLLGVWQGAWDAPPDEVRAISVGSEVRVPVGMGIVIPASKLAEILEMDTMKKQREKVKKEQDQASAASLDSISLPLRSASLLANDENPNAREDFMRLANAAARKQPQDD